MDNVDERNEVDSLINAYYDSILYSDNSKSIEEYKNHIEEVRIQFLEKTCIQGADIGFLFLGVMLQCARIYIINKITKQEKANVKGGKEDFLHDKQQKILEKFGKGENPTVSNLYASLDAIITTRGVPYDATSPFDDEIKKLHLFKGANHRFATLGHDPVVGLIIGTSNILTNTITTTKKIGPVPIVTTNNVVYDELLKNPQISTPVFTPTMLDAAIKRFDNDKASVAAATIKQLIHIATDLYTPCGIQLPGANMVLNRKTTEMLTKYISTGDVVKIGASAGMSILINTLLSAVHGSKLLFENSGEPFDEELYQARTRKVVMYSNVIASTSNVISTLVTKDAKNLDIGGLLVTMYRVFNDTRFICALEEEYINSEVSKQYFDRRGFDDELI